MLIGNLIDYGTEAVNDINDTSFSLDLYNTLMPEVALGSPTPTFTRASTATVTDCYGKIRNCKSGEARFEGARRVANLFTSSATLSTQTVTSLATTYTVSFTGSGTITFSGTYSGSLVGADGVRKAITFTTTAGSLVCTVSGSVTLAQCEEGSLPSEYVSNGTLSAPYHGCNVDSVKCFKTYNGNTVVNNVVTEAVGAPIPNSVLKRYLDEGSRTNLLSYSEDFSNVAWAQGIEYTISSTLFLSPFGRLNANKILETSATSSHMCGQTIGGVVDGSTYTFSVYVKAAERTWVQLLEDSGANQYGFVNLSSGTSGTINNCTLITEACVDGWYRISMTYAQTGTMAKLRILLAAGDVSSYYQGNTSNGIYIAGAQLEQASFASSYIPTTTAAATRAADSLKYSTVGNISLNDTTFFIEYSPKYQSTVISYFYPELFGMNTADGVNGFRLSLRKDLNITNSFQSGSSGGWIATSAFSLNTVVENSTNKICFREKDAGISEVFNGVASAVSSGIPRNALPSLMNIGESTDDNPDRQAFSNIGNIRIWTKALTDETLKSITS